MKRHIILSVIAITLVLAAVANAYMAPTQQEIRDSPSSHHHELLAVEGRAVEVCFPRTLWSARFEDLPCDLITPPEEDGSGTLILGTLGSDAAKCVIPNPYEERGKFVIHCHRVSNR